MPRIDLSNPEIWKQRGLNPSSGPIIQLMQNAVDGFESKLSSVSSTDQHLRDKIAASIDELPWQDLDTEERELLADAIRPAIEALGVPAFPFF